MNGQDCKEEGGRGEKGEREGGREREGGKEIERVVKGGGYK